MKFLTFQNPEAAATRAAELAGASVGYDPATQQVGGQAFVPMVLVHPDGRAAVGISTEGENSLTGTERRRLRGAERMVKDGWFNGDAGANEAGVS